MMKDRDKTEELTFIQESRPAEQLSAEKRVSNGGASPFLYQTQCPGLSASENGIFEGSHVQRAF